MLLSMGGRGGVGLREVWCCGVAPGSSVSQSTEERELILSRDGDTTGTFPLPSLFVVELLKNTSLELLARLVIWMSRFGI